MHEGKLRELECHQSYALLGAILFLFTILSFCPGQFLIAQGIGQPSQGQQGTGQATPVYPVYPNQPSSPTTATNVPPNGSSQGLVVSPQSSGNVVPPPFVLSPAEQEQLDRVLIAWEDRSSKIKTFECEFTRWEFDPVWGPPNQPKRIVRGKIMYAAPDKGLFRVDEEVVNGRLQTAVQPERWVCDGRSVYEYRFETKQIVETPLPPELQGKAITEGPLPFLFSAQAESLKRRYYMRIITPQNVRDEIWLEAFPRYQQEAANFQRAQLILKLPQLDIFALQLYHPSAQPTSQSRTVFQFDRIKTNAVDFLRLFKEDPFKPLLPDSSWAKVVESGSPAQPSPPAMGQRPSSYRAQ